MLSSLQSCCHNSIVLPFSQGEFDHPAEEDDSDSGSEVSEPARDNLCLPALKYLQQCCDILASMCNMPACPVFSGAHRSVSGSKVSIEVGGYSIQVKSVGCSFVHMGL